MRSEREASRAEGDRELLERLGLRFRAALSPTTWRCQGPTGEDVVVKTGAGTGRQAVEILTKLPHLHAEFHYPRLLRAEPGRYLMYAYIPGVPLSAEDFEDPAGQAQAFALAGRLSALFRSLNLVEMYQGLKGRQYEGELAVEAAGGRLARLAAGTGLQRGGLAQRREEAMSSYAWAQEALAAARVRLEGEEVLPAALWERLAALVEKTTSIHYAPSGSALAHAAFSPEHVLRCPEGGLGVLSWEAAPRPYNFMRLYYLGWCFVHSRREDAETRARRALEQMPSIDYTAAGLLSFLLAVLTVWQETGQALGGATEKRAAVRAWVEEAAGAEEREEAAGQ